MTCPRSIIILHPAPHADFIIQACQEILGKDISIDTLKKLSGGEEFLTYVASMKGMSGVQLHREFLQMVVYGVLILGDEWDIMDMMAVCSGMPFVLVDSKMRGVRASIVTGNLSQWREAVHSGCGLEHSLNVRGGFNALYELFVQEGLGNLWTNLTEVSNSDGTFLLE